MRRALALFDRTATVCYYVHMRFHHHYHQQYHCHNANAHRTNFFVTYIAICSPAIIESVFNSVLSIFSRCFVDRHKRRISFVGSLLHCFDRLGLGISGRKI